MDRHLDAVSDLEATVNAGWPHEWTPTGHGDEWRAVSDDDTEEAHVRALNDGFEARVHRRRGADEQGPDWRPVHGPQVFPSAGEALRWCEERISP
jgi:hypothetical protein